MAYLPIPLLMLSASIPLKRQVQWDSQRREIPGGVSLDSISVALRFFGEIFGLSFGQGSFSEESLFVTLVKMFDVAIPTRQSPLRFLPRERGTYASLRTATSIGTSPACKAEACKTRARREMMR